ncbi:peptidoglycan -binding protein [Rhodovarius crocodyli]|uniref:Peptidoglycan-binding protein n=1 Tax=Rhodovarius crocodyli TaxID=1979269 RepID=A0A437MCJ2_9PROT|nr:peptidoglycan -binding protein [Rhodovarius crocodyli]RVT95360.1 peptidoglycan -binding protein [Rhodovarius crocodyli]
MRSSRRGDHGINPWPGYVDALSTLLMVIIFVLLVFVLAQGFLSVALSSRDQALERLNRQVAELADLLALERGQGQELRGLLTRSETRLREAEAARDNFSSLLAQTRQEAEAATGARDAALAEAAGLRARITDLAASADAGGRRLDGLEARLNDALRRAESATGDAAEQLRRLAESGRALAGERDARSSAERIGRETAAALAAERGARTTAETRLAEAGTALARERETRTAAERDLRDSRGALETARQELATLRRRIEEANAALAAAQQRLDRMRAEIEGLNTTVRADRATIEARVAELAQLSADVRRLSALREELQRQLAEEQNRRGGAETATAEQSRLSEAARAQVALLTRQLNELRTQMQRLADALGASEARDREQEVQISTLRSQLNAALAARVEELTRYRSEFFGRLRDALGDRPELRIVGDRFVFQSEVLFPPASAELSPAGEVELRRLARVLVDIASRIPPEINWVLRVDGHADRNPIRSPRFASNWELSAARAIAVANLLIQEGLPANRVAAAAFGEHQPLDTADTPEAFARNRRIELRLTDR